MSSNLDAYVDAVERRYTRPSLPLLLPLPAHPYVDAVERRYARPPPATAASYSSAPAGVTCANGRCSVAAPTRRFRLFGGR